MIRCDPTLVALCESTKTETDCYAYCKEIGLLSDPKPIGSTERGAPVYGRCCDKPFNPQKPGCTGLITQVWKRNRSQYKCTVCRKEMSVHNGKGVFAANCAVQSSFFAHVDSSSRISRKISPRDVLILLWATAHNFPLNHLKMVAGVEIAESVQVYWSHYIRTLMVEKFDKAGPLAGAGDIVEIDESYLKGRRKYNKGRLLAGNVVNPNGSRSNNYLLRSQGPWIFGMISRRTKEVRLFHVKDRSGPTLIPIIQKHVGPGAHVYSDEWLPYKRLRLHGYHHQSVNHKNHFVCPVTRTHTQQIERVWRDLKQIHLRDGPGVAVTTIDSHLCRFWWNSCNGPTKCSDPFLRLVDLIRESYPT